MYSFELRPNCSLTLRSAAIFFAVIAAVSLAIAGSFAAAGYWPILPIAGLELLGLGAAMWLSMRQGGRRENIRIDDSRVIVQKHAGGREWQCAFARPWTRVDLVPPAARNWPNRLVLRSMGRSVEIGSFLTDEERDELQQRLRHVIGEWQYPDTMPVNN